MTCRRLESSINVPNRKGPGMSPSLMLFFNKLLVKYGFSHQMK
jgi:hypothetical protein